MTGVELIELVSRKTGIPKADVSSVLGISLSVISETVLGGETVKLRNFGVFYKRAGRTKKAFGRSHPGRTSVRFRPSRTGEAMDKYGVELEEGHEKQGSGGKGPSKCPSCGSDLDGPAHCPKCGTKPFERRTDKKAVR